MDKERIFRGSPRKKGEKNFGLFKTQEEWKRAPHKQKRKSTKLAAVLPNDMHPSMGSIEKENYPAHSTRLPSGKEKGPPLWERALRLERKEGDSNPRYPFEYVSLANWWFQPLTHPSFRITL